MADIHVGDTRREYVETLWEAFKGTVIYVHPRRRFYVVEFQFKSGSFREAYAIERLEQK